MKHRLTVTDRICGEIIEESYDIALLYKIATKYLGARNFTIEPIDYQDNIIQYFDIAA